MPADRVRPGGRAPFVARVAAAAVVVAASGAAAQEPGGTPPIETVVEYVAGSTFYVPAGSDAGLAAGDTLRVRRPGEDRVLGLLVVVGASGRRASLTFAGRPFPVTRGMTLLLEATGALGPPAGQPGGVAGAPADSGAHPLVGPPGPPGPPRPAPGSGAVPLSGDRREGIPDPFRVQGSAGIDLDAYRATSRWGGPGVPAVERSLVTPGLRLSAVATGLPLGLAARTSLRAGYRGGDALYEAGYLRVYEASLERSFRSVPLELRVGRFGDHLSSVRTIWDGGMIRLGGGGLGVGAVAGYEPARGDEGFSTAVEKWSVFAELRRRGRGFSYATDVALVDEGVPESGWSRRVVGWAQRVRWRGFFFSQRLELDVDPAGDADALTRAFLDLGVPVVSGLRLEASFARDVPTMRIVDTLPRLPITPGGRSARERWSAGASWSVGSASASARAGRVRQGDGPEASVLDGFLYLPAPARGLPGLGVAASYWDDGDLHSLFLSPALDRAVGGVDVRAAYQLHDTGGADGRRLHGGELTLTIPLRAGLRARLSALGQWGEAVTTLRSWSSLSVSF